MIRYKIRFVNQDTQQWHTSELERECLIQLLFNKPSPMRLLIIDFSPFSHELRCDAHKFVKLAKFCSTARQEEIQYDITIVVHFIVNARNCKIIKAYLLCSQSCDFFCASFIKFAQSPIQRTCTS